MSTSAVKLSVGSKVIIAEDTDLRGDITIGSGSVIHPKATIHALGAPITLGPGCIVEELAVIINRSDLPMRIGASNLFEVSSRLESVHQVGDHNTFAPRSRVIGPKLSVGSFISVGAGVVVSRESGPLAGLRASGIPGDSRGGAGEEEDWEMLLESDVGAADEGGSASAQPGQQQQLRVPHALHHPASAASGLSSTTATIPEETSEDEDQGDDVPAPPAKETASTTSASEEQHSIPDKTTLFLSCPSSSTSDDKGYAGATICSQPWSGQGFGQDEALHAKHLEYLRETIPRGHKLRSII